MQDTVRRLDCVLTEDELKIKSKLLAEAEIQLNDEEEELKDFVKEKKDEIKTLKVEIKELAVQVSTGKEERSVPCTWNFHKPVMGMKQLIRTDIGEVVDECDMTDYDKEQHQLSLQGRLAFGS